MQEKGFAHLILIVIVLAVIAVAAGSYFIFNPFKPTSQTQTTPQSQSTPIAQESPPSTLLTPLSYPTPSAKVATKSAVSTDCNAACQAYIDNKVAALKGDLISLIKSEVQKNQQPVGGLSLTSSTPTTTTSTTQPKITYLYFGVNGSTTSNSWTTVAGSQIKFDPANYPGATAFYFEATLLSDANDRTTYARIYDTTHNGAVQGSEMNYTGTTATLKEAGPLVLPPKAAEVVVQIHNLNVNTASVYNPRIKIVY